MHVYKVLLPVLLFIISVYLKLVSLVKINWVPELPAQLVKERLDTVIWMTLHCAISSLINLSARVTGLI